MQFKTVDELFEACTVADARRALLQTAGQATSKSQAVKQLVADKYHDLLSTADEASGMLDGVRSLIDKVQSVQAEAAQVIATAVESARHGFATAEVQEQIQRTPLENQLRLQTWMDGAVHSSFTSFDRGECCTGALTLVAQGIALSCYKRALPGQAHRHEAIHAAAAQQVLGKCKAVITSLLLHALESPYTEVSSGSGGGGGGRAAVVALASAVYALALLAAHARLQKEGAQDAGKVASYMHAALPSVLRQAVLGPTLAALQHALAQAQAQAPAVPGPAEGMKEEAAGAMPVQHACSKLRSVSSCLSLALACAHAVTSSGSSGEGGAGAGEGAGGVPAVCAWVLACVHATATPVLASRGGSGMDALPAPPSFLPPAPEGGPLAWCAWVSAGSAWERRREGREGKGVEALATGIHSVERLLMEQQVPSAPLAATSLASAWLREVCLPALAPSILSTVQGAVACEGQGHGAFVRLRGEMKQSCAALEATFPSLPALLGGPSTGLYSLLFASPMAAVGAQVVRGGLSARVQEVTARCTAVLAACATLARAGPLAPLAQLQGGASMEALRACNEYSPLSAAKEKELSALCARVAAGKAGVAAGEAEADPQAQLRKVRQAYSLVQEQRLLHSSFPDVHASSALHGCSLALLCAAGACEVDEEGAVRVRHAAVQDLTGAHNEWQVEGSVEPRLDGAELLHRLLSLYPPSTASLFSSRTQRACVLEGGAWTSHALGPSMAGAALVLVSSLVSALREYCSETGQQQQQQQQGSGSAGPAPTPTPAPDTALDGHAQGVLAQVLQLVQGHIQQAVASAAAASPSQYSCSTPASHTPVHLPAAYTALGGAHLAVLLASALPTPWLTQQQREGLLHSAACASSAWARSMAFHAGDSLAYAWASEGACVGGVGQAGGDALHARQAGRAWVKSHGEWAPLSLALAQKASAGDAPSAELHVPVAASQALSHALARFTRHMAYGGVTDPALPLPLHTLPALATMVGTGKGGQGMEVAKGLSTELWLAAHALPVRPSVTLPLARVMALLHKDKEGRGEGKQAEGYARVPVEVWGAPLWHAATLVDTEGESSSHGLRASEAVSALLATRQLATLTHTLAVDYLRVELARVYKGVVQAVAGSHPCEPLLMQVALDVGVAGALPQPAVLAPTQGQGQGGRYWEVVDKANAWSALTAGKPTGPVPASSLADRLLSLSLPTAQGQGQGEGVTWPALWAQATAAIDPVDWSLAKPAILLYSGEAVLAHGLHWHSACPSLASQTVTRRGGGWRVEVGGKQGAAGGRDEPQWDIPALIASKAGGNSSSSGSRQGGKGGGTPATAPSLLPLQLGGGLTSTTSTGTALLTAPYPLPLRVADLDPAEVPTLALLPTLPRMNVSSSGSGGSGGAGVGVGVGAGRAGTQVGLLGHDLMEALALGYDGAGAVPGGEGGQDLVEVTALLPSTPTLPLPLPGAGAGPGQRPGQGQGAESGARNRLLLPAPLAALLTPAGSGLGKGRRGRYSQGQGQQEGGEGGEGEGHGQAVEDATAVQAQAQAGTPGKAGPGTPLPATLPRGATTATPRTPATAGGGAGGSRPSGSLRGKLAAGLGSSLALLGLPVGGTPGSAAAATTGEGEVGLAGGDAIGRGAVSALSRLGLSALLGGDEEDEEGEGEGVGAQAGAGAGQGGKAIIAPPLVPTTASGGSLSTPGGSKAGTSTGGTAPTAGGKAGQGVGASLVDYLLQ